MDQTEGDQRTGEKGIMVERMGGGKGIDKEHVWMTHRHGQQCGNGLWEWGVGCVERGKGGILRQL